VTSPSNPESAVLIFSELAPAKAPTAIPAVRQTNSLRVSGMASLSVLHPNLAPGDLQFLQSGGPVSSRRAAGCSLAATVDFWKRSRGTKTM
jgi:hypothetical protein